MQKCILLVHHVITIIRYYRKNFSCKRDSQIKHKKKKKGQNRHYPSTGTLSTAQTEVQLGNYTQFLDILFGDWLLG